MCGTTHRERDPFDDVVPPFDVEKLILYVFAGCVGGVAREPRVLVIVSETSRHFSSLSSSSVEQFAPNNNYSGVIKTKQRRRTKKKANFFVRLFFPPFIITRDCK